MEERPDWQAVNKVGHPYHRRKELVTAADIEKMVKQGFSKRQIALYYQRSRGTIYRRIHEAEMAKENKRKADELARKKAEQERKRAEAEQKKAEKRRQADEKAERQRQVEAVRVSISELPPWGKGTIETRERRKRLRQRLIDLGMSDEDASRECGYPVSTSDHA
jgi:transposase